MADNGWMYNGRISATEMTDEWVWKTNLLVKELARGSKAGVRPNFPCANCRRRHRQGKERGGEREGAEERDHRGSR